MKMSLFYFLDRVVPTLSDVIITPEDGGSPRAATSGDYFTVMVTEPSTKIEAMFPMKFNVTRRYNNSAAIYYGLVVVYH